MDDTLLEAPAYKDDASSSQAPAGRVNGYALGATTKERMKVVLSREFPMQAAALSVRGMPISHVLTSVLDTNEDGRGERAIRALASDGRWHVRADLAAHLPRYVAGVFEMLGHDPVNCVRQAVAANKNTPPQLLERLRDDSDAIVAAAAQR